LSRFARLLTRAAFGYLTLLPALFLVESRFAEHHWILTTVAWAPQYPWLLGALLLTGLSGAARARKALVASLAAALFAALVLMGPALSLHRDSGEGPSVRVLTLNAGTGRTSSADLVELLRRATPDIVCLQEAGLALAGLSDGAALPVDGVEFTLVQDRGTAILTRLPLVAWEVHPLGFDTGRSVIEARVRTGEGEFTVLATHFFRGRIQSGAGRIGRALADLTRSGEIHAKQIERLLEIAGAAPEPQVIAGDLNLPPRGRLYRRLTTHHADAFRVAGMGYGYSFPASLPMLRIDYVLAGPGVRVRRCGVLSTAGSDHRAVLAEVTLR
jgi:vancomycin resistance protein VanJ